MATAVKKRTSKGKKRSKKEKTHEEDIDLGPQPGVSDLNNENLGHPSNLELEADNVVNDPLSNPTQKETHPDDTFHNACDEEIIDTEENVSVEGNVEFNVDSKQEIDETLPPMEEDNTSITLESKVSSDASQMGLTEDTIEATPDVEPKNLGSQVDIKENDTTEGTLQPDISKMEVEEEVVATAPIIEVAADDNVTSECALYPDISQMELKEEVVATAAIVDIAADVLENPTTREVSKGNATSEGTLYPAISQMEVQEEDVATAPIMENSDVPINTMIQENSNDNNTSGGTLYPDVSKMEINEVIPTAAIIEEAADVTENTTIQDDNKDNVPSEGTLYPNVMELKEVTPTAPIIEEAVTATPQTPTIVKEDSSDDFFITEKLKCMSLSQAENLFCGKEVAQIKLMSNREEEIVEKGSFNETDDPLLELLSTFRSSVIALQKERSELTQKSMEEELYRESLWRVKKMAKTVSANCPCGLKVSATVKYEDATLVMDKLPIGIMRVNTLFNDVQESYCHYQHAVFLAHRQIEGVIQEITLKTNAQIRLILNYLFHTLRNTDSDLNVFAECLKRWASALIPTMLKVGNLSDLLYLWHHLFRQNRSVSWAAELMTIRIGDFYELAQAIALLDLLFETAYIQMDLATECVEEGDDVWEEVDQSGAGSAVAAGALRESDILALLRCFPLRDAVARLVLIRHQKIDGVLEGEWGDKTGGHAVLKSICGARLLLSVLQKGLNAHPHYKQLAQEIVELAIQIVCALADLHAFARTSYSQDLLLQIFGELEAVFSALWVMTTSTELCVEKMPFSILTPRITRSCFTALSSNLHADTSTQVEGAITIQVPSHLSCKLKLLIITQIAVQSDDRHFVSTILHYLMQESFTRQIKPCPQKCQETARKSLHRILDKHHYLYTDAICAFSLVVFDDFVESSDIDFLSLGTWRPSPAEVTHVLITLAQSNLALVPVLLDALDYTPNVGLSHETQLAIGVFLCQRVVESQLPPAEWYWSVLRKMHLHMLEWNGYTDTDAITPDEKPEHLFVKMFNLLTTAWGHSLPLICENGVKVLLDLAKAGRTRETVYCLSYIMRVMAQSPESIGLTPMFSEVCNALMTSTPTLMQRAFGRGGNSGSLLLTKLIISQLYTNRRYEDDIMQLLSAWIHMCREHPTLVETALVSCHDYVELNHHMEDLLEDDFLFSTLSPTPATSPTLCLYMLRVEHSRRELRTGLWQKLLCELDVDRVAGNKPNVDRALNRCDATFTSDALVIHKMASAALTAPRTHPAHIKLWDWFFCLYMQKPINKPNGLPMGPMFFSGLLKSRTVAQLKKQVQDAAAHHWTEVKKLDGEEIGSKGSGALRISKTPVLPDPSTVDFLPELRLVHLLGSAKRRMERPINTLERNAMTEDTPDPSPPPSLHAIEVQHLKAYHLNAHRLFRSYLKCLEASDKGSVTHNVYFEREQVMLIWRNYLQSITPPTSEDDKYVIRVPMTCDTVPPPATIQSPLERLKARLSNYCSERKPIPSVVMQSTLRNIPNNNNSLVMLIGQLLQFIVKLASEWEVEIKAIDALNEELWKLVRNLRVPHQLSPVRRSCANNCEPVTLTISETDWPISDEARQAIRENRFKAVTTMRKMARPRPKVAVIIAALHRATGLVSDTAVAAEILMRVWRCATEAVNSCPPARNAIVTVVTDLTQEFICSDGLRTADFINQWCRTDQGVLKRELIKTLVDPQKLSPLHLLDVYRALLRVSLPVDVRFSFLSKFDLVAWEKVTTTLNKRDMLEVITQFMSRYGIEPAAPDNVLYELLCKHMCAVIDSDNLCGHLKNCTRYSVSIKFPRTAWTHINNLLATKFFNVPYKRLLALMPELTEIWMRGSVVIKQKPELQAAYASYAKDNVEILHRLTMLCLKCYNGDFEDVERFMNDLLSNSLIPSILPWFTADDKRLSNPIVTLEGHVNYTTEMFVKILNDICDLVPEATSCVLRNSFSWLSYISTNMEPLPRSSLLLQMQNLPWTEPYFTGHYVLHAIMLCCLDEDAKAFIRKALHLVPADLYLFDIEPGHIQNYLGIWLMGFTEDGVAGEFLQVAEQLPWHEMPPPTVEKYLQRYFNNREDPGLNDIRTMYKKTLKEYWLERPAQREITRSLLHLRPGFKILKAVSLMNTNLGVGHHTHMKRVTFIRYWVRAVTRINTDAEYKASTKALLEAVTELYQMTRRFEQINDILKHVVTLLNVETDTTPYGIPVWCEWVASVPHEVADCVVHNIASVVSFKNHADVGEAALKTYLRIDGNNWEKVHDHWKACVWRDSAALVRQGALLCAYAHSSHPTSEHTLGDTVTALSTSNINIVQHEPAVALWMCHMTRRVYRSDKEGAPPCREQEEVINASIALLRSWAEERRLNILRTFTRSVDIDAPTPHLRLIARLALCILCPSEDAVKIYENSHASIIRSTSALADTKLFAKNAKPISLPKLAQRLYSSYDGYFALEYELMSKM